MLPQAKATFCVSPCQSIYLQLLNWFDNQKSACYHCVTAWDKTSHCRVQAQGMLFDIMPDHKREIDDLHYLLCDALWSSQNSAPEAGAYVRRAAHALWLN